MDPLVATGGRLSAPHNYHIGFTIYGRYGALRHNGIIRVYLNAQRGLIGTAAAAPTVGHSGITIVRPHEKVYANVFYDPYYVGGVFGELWC